MWTEFGGEWARLLRHEVGDCGGDFGHSDWSYWGPSSGVPFSSVATPEVYPPSLYSASKRANLEVHALLQGGNGEKKKNEK
jgi:hypothetical protein